MAEVVYACRYEMAMTLEDVLARRLHIQIEDWSHGIESATAVARRMAGELGWSSDQMASQAARYCETVG